MGVYIPNMKMPRNCVDCEIERFADCGIWQGVSANDYIDKRYEYCPLIKKKTGKWINYKDEHRCSCCGEVIIGDWFYEDDAYSYCPNCGASMVNEVEE